MWELIRANKRNSVLLLVAMAAVLLLLGYIIGSVFAPGGGTLGLIIAAGIWLVLLMISFAGGDQVLLAASRAKKVTHDVHPQLFNVVEEMTIAASLPKMPDVYIINDPAPNAFATGRNPQSASVAVTAGLLARLNRDELQGVVAHEISHILHRDILFVTLAGIMLGSIVLLSEVFLRSMFYSSMMGRRRRYSGGSQGGGQAQLIMMVVAIACAILAPLFAYLLYFALSRRREYLADAGGARLTRYPEGLASALDKISKTDVKLATANKVTAPMYIINPLKLKGKKLADLTSTHPPISERIRILRNMTHGASLKDYCRSYSTVTGSKQALPASALNDTETVELRQAGGTPNAKEHVWGPPGTKAGKKRRKKDQMRQIGDIMRRVNQFAFLTCLCGLKMKVPPNFRGKNVVCPRCHKTVELTAK